MAEGRIRVVLCWHMHQPHYRDGLDGQYRLPWVYLHATKDYSDMVAHLESYPQARVVVNFAPVLLEQLDDYACSMWNWLKTGEAMADPLLNQLAGVTPVADSLETRFLVLQNCTKAFAPTMIDPHPVFRQLLNMCGESLPETLDQAAHLTYFSEEYFTDLLVWYHLAWMGQSVIANDERIRALFEKGQHFDLQDRRSLIEAIADLTGGLVGRYKALQDKGQIEISMTPYGHPIVPLLIDFNRTHDAMPGADLPKHSAYPDGKTRAHWHMERGIAAYRNFFGCEPKGVWLSEGAVSPEAVGLLDEFDIRWTASGEGVWRHSCEASHIDSHDISSKRALYQPLRHTDQNCAIFFRDDGMSDLIGFEYKTWGPDDAAANFAQNLENIANHLGDQVQDHVVSVILDGENPWEYFPDNGQQFLTSLYQTLSEHPRIEMTTFADALEQGCAIRPLPVLKSGSWVYGSFSTWIGEKDKNLGWDLLVEAKQAFDDVMAAETLSPEEVDAATEQLAICEGSDWFWWLGDYNPADSVRDFSLMYRRHLEKLYQLLKKDIPENLSSLQSNGRQGEGGHSGTMIRN